MKKRKYMLAFRSHSISLPQEPKYIWQKCLMITITSSKITFIITRVKLWSLFMPLNKTNNQKVNFFSELTLYNLTIASYKVRITIYKVTIKTRNSDFFSRNDTLMSQFWLYFSELGLYFSQLQVYIMQFWLFLRIASLYLRFMTF